VWDPETLLATWEHDASLWRLPPRIVPDVRYRKRAALIWSLLFLLIVFHAFRA
jgi:hypothetical protein